MRRLRSRSIPRRPPGTTRCAGSRGRFGGTLAIMATARELGYPLQVNTTITRHNVGADRCDGRDRRRHGCRGLERLLPRADRARPARQHPERPSARAGPAPAGRAVGQHAVPDQGHRGAELPPGHGPDRASAGPAAGFANDGKGFMFISCIGDVCPSGFLPLVAGNVRETSPVDIYRDAPTVRGAARPEPADRAAAGAVGSAPNAAAAAPAPTRSAATRSPRTRRACTSREPSSAQGRRSGRRRRAGHRPSPAPGDPASPLGVFHDQRAGVSRMSQAARRAPMFASWQSSSIASDVHVATTLCTRARPTPPRGRRWWSGRRRVRSGSPARPMPPRRSCGARPGELTHPRGGRDDRPPRAVRRRDAGNHRRRSAGAGGSRADRRDAGPHPRAARSCWRLARRRA